MEKKKTPRNAMLGWIQQNDPTRLKDRTVRPEKGKGKKDRPRENKVDDYLDKAA